MPEALPARRSLSLAIVLIVTGAIGWYSSFALTLDKFAVLIDPEADLDCNFSLLVQCGANLQSWQGSVFGFPNPVLGLAGFVAPIAVGVALLARATFARWFWIAFNVGVTGALAFCIWLMSQSIFSLGTLCPWCMVVWSVTIPLLVVTSAIALRPLHTNAVARAIYQWRWSLVALWFTSRVLLILVRFWEYWSTLL